jgi:hypothetical protein
VVGAKVASRVGRLDDHGLSGDRAGSELESGRGTFSLVMFLSYPMEQNLYSLIAGAAPAGLVAA